jgi:hypothetical protein
MKNTGGLRVAIVTLATIVCLATRLMAQDCFDDPDRCAGPRFWSENFDEDPLDVSPDDWQSRGNNELPLYEDGKAILDGSLSPWMLIDSVEHFFEGQTWIHIVMEANPADGPDNGAGWWVNADNEGTDGGFYAINAVLARNDAGEQEYRFGPANVTDEYIPVAEGGVDVTVSLAPNGNDEMDISYSIIDAVQTHTGEFTIVGRDGAGVVNDDKWFTLFANGPGQGIVDLVEVYNQLEPPVGGEPQLWAGDADMDLDFDQFDLIQVQVAAKYLSGQPATWGEGDWNAAPGGEVGSPPEGNGFFDQLDIIAALGPGHYLTGSYAAIAPDGERGDGQTSIVYNATTGELSVDAPAGTDLTSVNIDSASGIFANHQDVQNLDGSFDNHSPSNIFKATFGSSFGSLDFGAVAQVGLSAELVAGDLTVVGSLAGGGDLGEVDLVYIPEPTTGLLLGLALLGVLTIRRRTPGASDLAGGV